MTEASVGAGMSTVLMLGTLYLTKARATGPLHTGLVAFAMAGVTAGALIYGTFALPEFGAADAPIHKHVADRYLAKSVEETTVPNVVTSVLASYRGMDTLGETAVIFTAGIAVFLLLSGKYRPGARTADVASKELPNRFVETDEAQSGSQPKGSSGQRHARRKKPVSKSGRRRRG